MDNQPIKWETKSIDLPDHIWKALGRIAKEEYLTGRGKALYQHIKHLPIFDDPTITNGTSTPKPLIAPGWKGELNKIEME